MKRKLRPAAVARWGAIVAALLLAAPAVASGESLYEQLCCGNETVVSQSFPSQPNFDVQVADDFTVPAGRSWSIDEIVSLWAAEDPDSEHFPTNNVFIYSDTGLGYPGSQVYAQTGNSTPPQLLNESGDIYKYEVAVAPPPLAAGTYWLSLQVNGNQGTSGIWRWGEVAPGAGSPAVLRNPGDGFGSGCTAWTPRTVCVSSSESEPGQSLALRGTSTSTEPPPPPPAPQTPPPPPARLPSNSIELVGGASPGTASGAATLVVEVPGPGVLTANGKGVKSVRVKVAQAGRVKVKVKLDTAGKKRLKKSKRHTVKVKVEITFTPTGGDPSKVTKTVTFRGKRG